MARADASITHAYWIDPKSGCVLLEHHRDRASPPRLELVSDTLRMVNLRAADPEFVGRFQGWYERGDGRIVFCQEARRHPQVDAVKTPVRVAGPFNAWGNDAADGRWELRPRVAADGAEVWECVVERADLHLGHHGVMFKFVTSEWYWLTVLNCAPNRVVDAAGNTNYRIATGGSAFVFDVAGGRALVGSHFVTLPSARAQPPVPVVPGLTFYDLATDLPLGARVEARKSRFGFPGARHATVFRLFAPRASAVIVEVFEDLDDPDVQPHPMKLRDDGLTWEATVAGDLHGCYYFYRVDGENDGRTTRFDSGMRILDPWALAVVGPTGPGIVVDTARLPQVPESRRFKPPYWQDLVVLEAHVRDLTARAPLELTDAERAGFRGLARWIADDACYVSRLGVNALELLPVHQFDVPDAAQYHWGYMTTNFFSPCSQYAEAPERASQIEEFREVVEACHRRGLAVILDVVYNHVGEPPFLSYIDKDYYFHLEPDGTFTNWSGCGNVLKAESAMTSRLIIESLTHFVRTYDVDGFRLDLAELLTVEALCEIERALKAVKESVIIIAEPWSFRGNISWHLRALGVSFWNDGYREFIASYVRGGGDAGTLRYFMKGSLDHLTVFPAQSVNYAASHDDHCWIDKVTENPGHDGREPASHDVHRTHLMVAMLMCSVGIPMLAAGQDFLHSKHGHRDTYLRGDLNALDYDRLTRFGATHDYFRQWIALRRSSWGELVRLWERPGPGYLRLFEVEGRAGAALVFNADGALGPRRLLFAINPQGEPLSIPLGDLPLDGWLEVADRQVVNLGGIFNGRLSVEHRHVTLGPLDCGLWIHSG